MDLKDMILISVDDHIVEPPDMFERRLPRKYQDRAPRVVGTAETGVFRWVFEGAASPSLTTAATVGRPASEKMIEPTSYEHIRPGAYDVHERVKDMSANGVLAALNFPSFPRFAGQIFTNVAKTDPDLALAVLQAYNDWHIDEWCGSYPDRFIPCAVTPMWDPKLQAAEVRRVAEKGCHAVTFSMNPYKLDLPSLHSDTWDPFWAACDELETIVCTHLGSASYEVITSPDAPYLSRWSVIGAMLMYTAADLVWSPVFRKFDKLKFALSEGGIGWIPSLLERVDYVYEHHVSWDTKSEYHGKLPSEILLERLVTCFIQDEVGVDNLGRLNTDMVTWESDYPHPDSTWPLSPESAFASLDRLGDDALVNKITHENAMRVFQFDPFSIRPREQCTVGALRSEVVGRDLSNQHARQMSSAGSKKQGENIFAQATQ